MLSRTASNLYWMARYLERAESTVRLLAACFRPGLPFDGEITKLHALPLQIQGVYEEFEEVFGDVVTFENVVQFLISSNSRASVRSCLEAARENARSERSRLSSEVWESINQTWLEFQEMQYRSLNVFTDWLKQRLFVFQGAVQITMPVALSVKFISLGTFIESADQTLRVLEAKGVLRSLSNQSDYYHWHMLLKSVSSFEAFQENSAASPSQDSVFEFLLFNPTLPRSVRYCISQVENLLASLGVETRIAPLKSTANLLVKLRFDNMNDILECGQNEYIQNLQDEVLQLGEAINEGYFTII